MSEQEFAPIKDMFKNRGRNANQLPGKQVHFIPAERAKTVLDLDERIQKLRNDGPMILAWAGLIFVLILKEFI